MEHCRNCNENIQEEFKFCPFCGVDLKSPKKCRKCNFSNEYNSKFCQECGNKLLNARNRKGKSKDIKTKTPILEIPIPDYGLTIEFNFSTSQNFEFALIEAQKFDTFLKIGDSKKAKYRVTIPENEIEDLSNLIECLKGWRNRKVYHNGIKVNWDSVFSYSWCHSKKKASYKPELYCFGFEDDYNYNLWGCINSRLNFNQNSDLFTYGKWLNLKADWEFDKERIKHELERNLFQYKFCPALNFGLISEVINAFPEVVNPKNDADWDFVRSYRSTDGLKVVVESFGYKEDQYMKGAYPKNMKKFIQGIAGKLKTKLPQGI